MRFPFFRNRDSVKNGILISIRRTGDGFHPGLFNELRNNGASYKNQRESGFQLYAKMVSCYHYST